MAYHLHKKKHLSSFQIIILDFAGVILLGTFLLMLPFSSQSGICTPFHQALFTATSAVCVTGLVVLDTASYWSLFGQFIILMLIQIGGLGVITVTASFALISGKKITLMQRSTMQEAIAAPKVGGIVRLTGFILKATFFFELVGALLMMPVFCKDFGIKGIWLSLFHSISAFCNAGFDLMGTINAPFVSLTKYAGNTIINLTIMLLIIIGGIGFLTWEDIRTNKLRFRCYRMQSKVILVTTLLLILIPAVIFFFSDYAQMTTKDRVLCSLFQAITPRTAGFNTTDLTVMGEHNLAIIIVLMLIGGSPGSTAGGMKTTTIAVLFANVIATFRRKEYAEIFDRRIDSDAIRNAATIFIMYLFLFFCSALYISCIEQLPLNVCLFETASAIGTVGLSLGITPTLSLLSQSILILLMFFGRVGGLTLIFAALSGTSRNLVKLPQEKITVG